MTIPTRLKMVLFGCFLVAMLGCALTAPSGQESRTPTPVDTAVVVTETPTPPDSSPTPAITREPPTATFSPGPSPTVGTTDGGTLQEGVVSPPPLPEGVTLHREPVVPEDLETVAALAHTDVPMRDLRDLAIRLRNVRPDVPVAVRDTSPDYPLGTLYTFQIHNDDTDETFLVEAELRYKTEHVYMWVERGVDIEPSQLQAAADVFEDQIYPTNRAFFGSEWSPGVDGDLHLSILHARRIGSGVAGYYWSADEYPLEVRPDSNQMEMFYINADNTDVGSVFYLGTLAHEFQHMIHWYNDRNEETWLNEGMSELASLLNGFDPGGSDYAWSRRPDTQLNAWSDDNARSAHYGASFLFATYLLDRFGEAFTQAVVAQPLNGIASIDAVLAQNDTGLTFTDLFADWVVSVYLDDPQLADGRYGYDLIDTAQPRLDIEHDHFPAGRASSVAQYGVDYVFLGGGRDLVLSFYGETRVRLLAADPHSGHFYWYSNRGDDSDMRLTRAFDLSGLTQATLRFWTWYDIEADWDYGYVQVSADNGATWQILPGPATTGSNPHSNNYGWGYTGKSGDGPTWIEQEIDLSAYAGRQILLRFEYVTDDALNFPGWAIDDIAIPELGYADDVEGGDGGWQAEGFVRTHGFVPQNYLVQLITFGSGEPAVTRLLLRDDQTGQWRLPLSDADHGVLLISALAPVTTEPARYFYRLEQE